MKISLFTGDIASAPADAICTSTNPKLSLMMGTGGAVREKGGFEILRECEALLAAETERSGRDRMPLGSVWVTGAGSLPYRAVLHCVASDTRARSSEALIRACVEKAVAEAVRLGCRTLAMPVFATGHAHFPFDRALETILDAFRSASPDLDEIVIVVHDEALRSQAEAML